MRKIIIFILFLVVIFSFYIFSFSDNRHSEEITEENKILMASILQSDNHLLKVMDSNNIIYVFNLENDFSAGDNIKIEYDGLLDENKAIQEVNVLKCDLTKEDVSSNSMFNKYYDLAYKKLENMSLDEKISQLLLVRYPESDGLGVLSQNQFGGYVFFARDFKDKGYDEVKKMMSDLQGVSKIPILTAVDEEGGKVVRISSNPNLASLPFKSSRELYLSGGFDLIKEDTIQKSKLLYDLGINLNLAPVVDVSTNPSDYMYFRALGEDSKVTSKYARTVISASKGLGVSYTLKHFPGYGNNADTHTQAASDGRSFSDILKNDLPPFEAGIEEGAEAVLVSHNIVNSIDNENPASLSFLIHNLLRGRLGFGGIIMTDDLAMGATNDIENSTVKAILSGNDLIIVTDYAKSIKEIKEAINNNLISEKLIDRIALKIISFKYYKDMF